MADTNLGLDLHSSSPEPGNFFGAQSSLGGAQFSFGGHGPGMPPVAPGLGIMPAALKCCLCSFSTAIPNILGRGFGSNLIVLDHNPEIELPMS